MTTGNQRSRSGPGKPRAVFLCGFMGSGKTTVGQAVAKRLGWNFVDIDRQIESLSGRTISDIFRKKGEPAFRAMESEQISKIIDRVNERPVVVSLGGGALMAESNQQKILDSRQRLIFLDADPSELLYRCRQELGTRPLFQNENQFRQLYEARRSGYMKAEIRVDTAGKAVSEIVEEIITRLGLVDEHSEGTPHAR